MSLNMYEILKTETAKVNFLKGLVRLAKADSQISEEESQYFTAAAVNLGISEAGVYEINEAISTDKKIDVEFDTYIEKAFFIREGIQLCEVDEKYDEKEKETVREMSAEIGLKDEDLYKIESWVMEGMAWKKRGDDLIISIEG